MPRAWRGPLVLENVQSGDGRVIAAGAVQWVDPPLPLAWITEGDQHIDLVTASPVVGNITMIARQADGRILGSGVLFDDQPEGAEVVRRLQAGEAPLGSRWGISIDPDDWALQVVDTQAEPGSDQAVVIMASASPGQPLPTREQVHGALVASLRASAGEPDPEGEIMFEDSADWWTMRFTKLRIRGATLCAVAAFDGASIELDDSTPVVAAVDGVEHDFIDDDGDGFCEFCMTEDSDGNCTSQCGLSVDMHAMANLSEAADQAEDQEDADEAVTAASAPVAPPVAWFRVGEPDLGSDLWVEQDDGTLAVPLTITDDGQVFGHLARWGACHTGYLDRCVSPPPSLRAYADFMVGEMRCEGGERVAVGTLTVGTDHAAAHLLAPLARDHYANTGLGWASVVVSSGEVGPWVAGAVAPHVMADEQALRLLRATVLSGDWRPIGGGLELVAALSVNAPGFPIQRVPMSLAASASVVEVLSVVPRLALDAEGQPVSMVAAGMVSRCSECAARARAEADMRELVEDRERMLDAFAAMGATLDRIDRRTRHLLPEAMAAAASKVLGG